MIRDTSRKEKKLDIDSNSDILEKLTQFEKYFQRKSILQIIDTDTIVFEKKNNQYDILNQMKWELNLHFFDKETCEIFDVLDDLIKKSLRNSLDDDSIVKFIHNIQHDIDKGDYDQSS